MYRMVNGETVKLTPEEAAEILAAQAAAQPQEPAPAVPIIYAIAHLTITDGAVSAVTPSARIGGAFYIDVGIYWVFFAEPQPDDNYIPLCYNHGHSVFVSERYEDFFVISATLDGVPSDPPSITVEIKRVN